MIPPARQQSRWECAVTRYALTHVFATTHAHTHTHIHTHTTTTTQHKSEIEKGGRERERRRRRRRRKGGDRVLEKKRQETHFLLDELLDLVLPKVEISEEMVHPIQFILHPLHNRTRQRLLRPAKAPLAHSTLSYPNDIPPRVVVDGTGLSREAVKDFA